MTTPRRPSPKTGRDDMVPEGTSRPMQSLCRGAERKGEGQLDRKCYTAISVRSRSASRHAAAGNRCDTHERGTAVGTCASEARPSRVVCAWPAPPGRFGVVAVTAVVGIAYLPPIDSLGCRFWHALVDLQAIHSHPSYPGKNTRTHALISAIPTRRKRRLLIVSRACLSGAWYM